MTIVGTLWQIAWGNPYTTPPEGAPRVLAEYFCPGHVSQCPREISDFAYSLGGGYGLGVSHFEHHRRLSQESKASIRKKRLKDRVEKTAPLFAEQIIADEIAKKPEYFDGITAPETEQALHDSDERLASLQENANTLIVFAQEPEECKRQAEALRAEMAEIGRKAAERRAARSPVQATTEMPECQAHNDGITQDLLVTLER